MPENGKYMDNFETFNIFSNITQIWGVFFLPIVSMVLVLTFTFFLLGKQYIRRIYQKYKIIKIDNEYYRQKHVKTKKRLNKSKNTQVILIPLSEISEKMITMIHSPIVLIALALLLAYAMNKIIEACSALYPIWYSIIGSRMLLYSSSKEIIAEIWTYFPEYTLELLYQKISTLGEECSYVKYVDRSAINMLGNISKICSVLCLVNFFIHKPKVKIYLKTTVLLCICLFTTIISFYFQFQKDTKILEQKVYYVEKQLTLDKPTVLNNYEAFQLSVEKVENELRYVENNRFYGSFIVNIGKYSIIL